MPKRRKKLTNIECKNTVNLFIEAIEMCEQLSVRTYLNQKLPVLDNRTYNVVFEFTEEESKKIELFKDVFFKSIGYESDILETSWQICTICTLFQDSRYFLALSFTKPEIQSDYQSEDLDAIIKFYKFLKSRDICDYVLIDKGQIQLEYNKARMILELY